MKSLLIKSGLGALAVKIGSALLSFATVVVLSRYLGPHEYGIYAFTIAAIAIISVPTQLGVPLLVVRETAKFDAGEQWPKLVALWRWSFSIVLKFSVVASIGVIATGLIFQNEKTHLLMMASPLIFAISLGALRGAALQGLRHVVLGQVPEKFALPALHLCFIVVIFQVWRPSAAATVVSHVVAGVLSFLLGALLLKRNLRDEIVSAKPHFDLRSERAWIRSALPLGVTSGAMITNKNIGLVCLGLLATSEAAGIYKVVNGISLFALFGLQAARIVVEPYFSRLHALDDSENLRRLGAWTSWMVFALACGVILVVVVAGEKTIGDVFGEKFKGGFLPLLIVLAAQAVAGATSAASAALNMTGHERVPMIVTCSGALLNALICVSLVPLTGTMGAAVAYSLSTVAVAVSMSYICKKRLGFSGSIFDSFSLHRGK